MATITTTVTFIGQATSGEKSIDSQPLLTVDINVVERQALKFSETVFRGTNASSNVKAFPVSVKGNKSALKHTYTPKIFVGSSLPIERYVAKIDDLNINVVDTQNYVIVTGSGIAIGIIPYWS